MLCSGPLRQQLDHGPVQIRTPSGNEAGSAAIQSKGPAFPIGYHAASALHDGCVGKIVIRRQIGFHHQIHETRRKQPIAITIGAETGHSYRIGQALEAVCRRTREHLRGSGAQGRESQVLASPGSDPRTVQGSGSILYAKPTLPIHRLVDDAENGNPPARQGNQGPKYGDSAQEGLGAINGIDDPDVLGVRLVGAGLFADDAVVGIREADNPPQFGLYGPIHGGHRRVIGFILDCDGFPVVGKDDLPRRVGKAVGEGNEGFQWVSQVVDRFRCIDWGE